MSRLGLGPILAVQLNCETCAKARSNLRRPFPPPENQASTSTQFTPTPSEETPSILGAIAGAELCSCKTPIQHLFWSFHLSQLDCVKTTRAPDAH